MNTPRPLDELLAAAETANRLEAEAKSAKMQVGHAVKDLRSAAGWNQVQFAAALGVSQSYLSQIETGIRTPSTSTMNKIATTASTSDTVIYTIKEGTHAQEEDTTDND